jgi:DNA-binding transcriptional LysR family regulator
MDTLDLMRTYVTVVDSMSFTAAGQRLGKSKALVSKHVGELEQRLGARLLNRTTRQVRTTEIGQAYYERARLLIGDFDALETTVKEEVGRPRGRLKVTAPQTLGEAEMIELVVAFRKAYPEVDLEILLADRIVDLVGEGYEVALRITTLQDSSLIVRKLCDVRLLLCTTPHYMRKRPMPKRPEDVMGLDCIVDFNIRWRENWRFGEGEAATVVKVAPRLSVNSARAVYNAIHAGLGVGFVPEFVVARDLAAGSLIALLEQQTTSRLGVYLVYPHRQHLSGKVRAFVDFVAQWYTPLPPWLQPAP